MRITLMGLFIAIGVIGSTTIWFPVGIAKAYPVQHMINVISAVFLGPIPAVLVAFGIALIRNLLGIGTLLAFPGGMIGALIAGLLYRKFHHIWGAVMGEIIGTGMIASLLCVPIAQLLMGKAVGAFVFMIPFILSSFSGAILAWIILGVLNKKITIFKIYE